MIVLVLVHRDSKEQRKPPPAGEQRAAMLHTFLQPPNRSTDLFEVRVQGPLAVRDIVAELTPGVPANAGLCCIQAARPRAEECGERLEVR